MEDLITKNVFLDTSVFIQENFQFKSDKFDKLKHDSICEKVRVFTHEIIINELRSNISSEIDSAISNLKIARKGGKIFWNLPEEKVNFIFEKQDPEYYKQKLFDLMDDYFKASKTSYIPNSYDVEKIFKNYFEKKPPFGEGKKKSEFPDAFVLSALENWCKINDEKMYVVSLDKDWKESIKEFENLYCLESLNEFIQLSTLHYDTIAEISKEVFDENVHLIEDRLENIFLDLPFFIEEIDGDVTSVEIKTIEILDDFLLSTKSDNNLQKYSSKFELSAKVNFSTEVHYGDESTALYDSEENRLMIWEYIDKLIESEVEITVEVQLSFDKDNILIDVDNIQITDPKDIWVSVYDDKYPFK
jgi:hypothetical protein